MKIKNPKNSILLLLAVGALVLSGCSGDSDEKNGGALVTSISVAGVSVTTVPGAIPKSDWDNPDFDLFNLETSQVGQVVINDADLLTEAQIVVAASAGAKVKYAAVEFDPPETFQDASKLTLFNNGYLCIQVTSEDGKSVNYYVVEIRLSNTLTSLNKVTVGGIDATALGTPNADWSAATAGSVGLSAATKDNAAVTVTKANANQTVKYAKVTGSAAPTFGDTATFSFNDGDFLYLEVTAENGVNKTVYKLEVQVGRDTTLSALSIGEVEVVTRGTSAAALADVTPGTVLFSTRQPGGGYAVSVTPTDTDASVKWAAVENNDPNTAAFGTTSPLVFTDQGYLYVEVTAANGTTKAYYKIQVNLMMTATINYGKPVIKASSEKYIDAAWEDVTETY
ncbi:MAG: hypothetical protein LBG05_09745, partial [Treponema sp.]|nr:hypothetical protein [Treponema sp.]